MQSRGVSATVFSIALSVGSSSGYAQWLTGWFEYGGHWYRLTEPMPWTDAEAQAVSVGGHLVTVNDAAENQWLTEVLLPQATEGFFGRTFWIGLYQIPGSSEPDGGWVWISDEPVTYLNWNPSEPSDGFGGEWVAHLWDAYPPNNQLAGRWNDLASDSWLGTPISGAVETAAPPAVIINAFTRKRHGGNIDLIDIPISIDGGVALQNVTSESRISGISDLHVGFDRPPGGPGSNPVILESQAGCPPGDPDLYQPHATFYTTTLVGNELVLHFAPSLPNARTYRITVGVEVTSTTGQNIEVRGLVGDITSDGRVNGGDRSAVVGAWTGNGFSPASDVDLSGRTDGGDRSIVVAVWTGAQNCAP